ncbi:hypothetical protein [Brevibacillus fulvus]|uniref:Uncharacterized protein n=1 Tax=Brevibacillus fulvus TaxID=1125967 RepID=A0A938Y5C0_9BACL|nr:hypothetical protein [Brevibacillus fulvus]MBM7591535.1 hypothetical protein [Brevibacillus fulvus]
MASLTLTDDDAGSEGVDHYKVFVSVNTMPGTDPAADSYQTVSSAGTQDIDLASLVNGPVVPSDGDSVIFTVVAFDAAHNASSPSGNDSTMVTWDQQGPNQPTGLTFVDNPDSNTMSYYWDDQSGDPDLDHFEAYYNKDTEPTTTEYGYHSTYTKTYRGNNLIRGTGKILDVLGVEDGDTVFIKVYAVDKFGNWSEAATVSAVYSLSNTTNN